LPKDWGRYVDAPLIKRELDMLRKSVNRQSPYGAQAWQMKVGRELGLESTLRPRGRPKKRIGIEKGKKK
jgi:putative transposase